MITWRTRYNRPLCMFRTKDNFCLTGRKINTTGLDFAFDDSEYADDTAVLFDSRNDLVEFTPFSIIFDVSEWRTSTILINRRKPKFFLLLVLISHITIQRLLMDKTYPNWTLGVVKFYLLSIGALKKYVFANSSIYGWVKASVYKSLILPIALYRSESWCLTEKLYDLLCMFHHRCVRAMCRVTMAHVRQHGITTEELLIRLGLQIST